MSDTPLLASQATIDALNSERAYQAATARKWQHQNAPSLEAELLLMESYVRLAIDAWRTSNGNLSALEQLRKLGCILLRCLDNHPGVPLRGHALENICLT